ncbi:DUF3800 domain-containing protein [Candidatus Gracilibacteria bacterium]|nr:DUF3800 domain-containing protein [Candidatus Gracilibacteria bacterium]
MTKQALLATILFSAEQPYFVYSSVATNNTDASIAVRDVIATYKLQMPELKGGKLTKSNRGKDAARFILNKFAKDTSTIFADKSYAVACKFFEYVFEPVLSSHSTWFYNINFHRFISNSLYVHYLAKDQMARQLLIDFEDSMRRKDFSKIEQIYHLTSSNNKASPFMRDITTFCVCHKDRIRDELDTLWSIDHLGGWSLELSMTSLHSLLGGWSGRFDSMEVACDDSKPLSTQINMLDSMIGRDDRITIEMAGRKQVVVYNLTAPVRLVSSKDNPAIQIADVFASSIAYALKHQEEDFSKDVLRICEESIDENSVYPGAEHADLFSESGYINGNLLQLLIRRTLRGEDLFEGIPAFINQAKRAYPNWVCTMRR